MRISTNLVYQQAVANMQRQQSLLAKTQQQMSLGTRMVSPSDDPVGASRVLVVEQARATNEQYGVNRNNAGSSLTLEESTLGGITTLLQNVRTSVLYAGNPTLSNADRKMIAIELRSRFEELLGLANTTDGEGLYLFSGYQNSSQPFTGTPGSVAYNGDQGQRLIQVSATRQIPVSDAGTDVFFTSGGGNDAFYEMTATANIGTGVIGHASIAAPASLSRTNAPTIDSYSIRFPTSTTYEVYNTTTRNTVPVATGAYNPATGGTISFEGMQVRLTGAPSAGDEFTVTPSKPIFGALSDLITAIETPVTSTSGTAALGDAIKAGLANLDQALDRVLAVRADVGARLQEIDSLDDLGETTGLQHEKTLSDLRDLDYAAAISDFTRQQLVLEAAQKSFTKIAGMSLFDFL
jgi:flagellar hook-associated protein 3 FlgL